MKTIFALELETVSLRKCEEYIVSLYFEFSAEIYIYTKKYTLASYKIFYLWYLE